MALTITNFPQLDLEPVYTPFYFRSTSNISNEPGFKYVYYLYTVNPVTNTDSSLLATIKLFPQSDGSGIFSPARILESQLSYDFSPFGSGFTTCPNSFEQYKVKFGEEYNVTGVTFSSITDNSGFVQYNLNSVPSPTYLIGDVIKIDKTLKNVNLDYDGLQTITAISGADITTDKVYGVASANESGECISRLTIQTGLTTTGTCINFARQYEDTSTRNFASEYILSGSTSKYLTDISGNIRIDTDEVFTLGAIEPNFGSGCTGALVYTYDSSGVGIGVYQVDKSDSPYDVFNFRCGTNNLAQTAGYNIFTATYDIIYTSAVKQYLVVLLSGVSQISEFKTFDVVDNCGYNSVRLAWLNKRGQWSYFNFDMKYYRKVETNREYVQNNLAYNYEVGDNMEIVTATKANAIITLNTNDYLTDAEARHLESLWTSPQVYWCVNSSETYLPFVITSKEYIGKSKTNNKSIQYKLEGRFGFSTNLQRN